MIFRIMKILRFLLPWSMVCFVGTPGRTTELHCDYGCILAVLSSGEEKFACAGLPLKLDPDSDGIYRVKIYSGFPLFHNDDEFTTPLYDQGYVWSENYERVTVDRNNCLKIRVLFILVLDGIGRCPPTDYHQGGVTNPYWLHANPNGRAFSDGAIDFADTSTLSNLPIPFLDIQPPSLFSSGGAGASADPPSWADSPSSIFQDDDPVLLSSDADNRPSDMNFNSALIASDDFGSGREDYSLFEGTV